MSEIDKINKSLNAGLNSKKVNFLLSNTNFGGFYAVVDEVFEKIKQDKSQSVILIVPDKFSLNAEQIFMERTGLSSIFGVWITTLSRLVSKVVAKDMNALTLLTKNSGIMLVSKIIQQNKDKISTYKKISGSYALAETMYNAINLLKSSGVEPNELKKNFSNTNFGLKIQDIYLVYSEYEKAMSENIDTITRLQIFDKKVKYDDYIKSSDIYFSMFDGFTNVQINSLCELAKSAKSLTLNLCANTKQKNANLYDNTLYYRIKDSLDQSHIDNGTYNAKVKLSEMQNFLATNLFAFDTKDTFNTDSIRLMQCDNVDDEARYVAGRIKYLVMEQGYSFDDIDVAVNGLEDYELAIKKIFDEYDLPFYVDSPRSLLDHFFTKTFLSIANFVCGEKTQANAISIVKSPIFDIEYSKKCDFDNFCHKYNIFGDMFFKPFTFESSTQSINAEEVRKFVFEPIMRFQNQMQSQTTFNKKIDCVKNFLTEIDVENTLKKLAEVEEDVLQKKLLSEVLTKFLAVFNEAESMLFDEEVSNEMFFEMLASVMKTVNLLTVPIMCDAVFVGDSSQSTFIPKKAMFVMGSAEGRMPAYQGDAGTITDEEIDKFISSKRISPTIKELNKREKFKLFCLLVSADKLLELSFSNLVGENIGQKSEFITAIQNIITQNEKPLKVQKYAFEELKVFENSDKKLAYYSIGTLKNAILLQKSQKSKLRFLLEREFNSIVKEQEAILKDKESRFDLSEPKSYMFAENKTSISQIERYFKCPFMQFVDYGIRPKENEKVEFDAMAIGSILHKTAEVFVNYLIEHNFECENVDELSDKIFARVMNLDDFKRYAENNYFVAILKDEVHRFLKAIKYHTDNSEFKPSFAEYHFENYSLENGIVFSGYVDRVDISNALNDVRIVDYKSGSDKFSFSDIYYGLKLQLLAYLKVLCEKFQKSPAGAMYMPIKNKFGDLFDEEFKSYKLDGVFLNDVGTIKHLDTNLVTNNTSDIISVALTKNDEVNKRYMGHVLTSEEFENLLAYTFDAILNATNEMIAGYICPKPYKINKNYPCEFCKYKALCHYDIEKSGFREITSKNKESFNRNKK